jgi:hypothetical protein
LKRTVLVLCWVIAVAPQVSAACFDFPENQVPACGFETIAEIGQWTVPWGSVELTSSPVHSGSGAALLQSSTYPPALSAIQVESSCFPASGSEPMGYGISVFPVNRPVSCAANVFNCSDSACSSCNPVGGLGYEIPMGEWTLVTFGEAGTYGMPFAKLGLS